MPLRAVDNSGNNLHAFDYGSASWKELKSTYRSLCLRMPCCSNTAIPKTSPLGTHFFAHARSGTCTSAPETAEHIYCKMVISEAARAAGWTVTTERPGATPDGQSWVADVFCEHGSAQVALEVQLSPQSLEDTRRRQQRYRASGVRGAWFYGEKLRRDAIFSDRDTPIFTLSKFTHGHEPVVEQYGIRLTDFVTCLLNRRLQWMLLAQTPLFYLGYLQKTCGKCKQPTKLAYAYSESLEDSGHDAFSGVVTADSISAALERLQETMSNAELERRGFAPVATVHMSRRTGRRIIYESFSCPRCGALLDNARLAQQANEARYGSGQAVVNADGEVTDHPIGIALIDRNSDGSGQWVLQSEHDREDNKDS